MRIALISETFLPNVNGVVTTLCRTLEHLQRRGHEAILFAPYDSPASYAGAEIVPLAGMPLPLYPELKFTPPQPGITGRLRAFRPDLVHMAGTVALGPTSRYAAAVLALPLVATYHTDIPAYSAHYRLGFLRNLTYRYLRWVHNGCALTLCPSAATLSDLRAHGFRRLRHWSRGVDTERFHPQWRSLEWRRSLGLRDDEPMLLYVGRLAPEKRLDVLVEAVRDLHGARLVLVGDGPARPQLERQLAGGSVHFTGFLRGAELAMAYASADLFVFPSDSETFGQVIQEAMASGLPVVAARAGGAIDLVREGVTGALFTPGNAPALRAEIVRLLANQQLRAAMSSACRAAAERRSWSKVLDELLSYYERVARRQRFRVIRR